MTADLRKIETFAPFSAAFDLIKLIVFQPFNFTKWLTIDFAVLVGGLADGTRMNFNFSARRNGNG